MKFDLLIRGGEVVDPGGGHEGRLDVAVSRDCGAAPPAPWAEDPIWPEVQKPFTERQQALRDRGHTPAALRAAAEAAEAGP